MILNKKIYNVKLKNYQLHNKNLNTNMILQINNYRNRKVILKHYKNKFNKGIKNLNKKYYIIKIKQTNYKMKLMNRNRKICKWLQMCKKNSKVLEFFKQNMIKQKDVLKVSKKD